MYFIVNFLFQVVNNNLNPVWNQTFDFVVEDGLHDMLIVEVWDHDTFGKVQRKKNYLLLFFKFFIIYLRNGTVVIIIGP